MIRKLFTLIFLIFCLNSFSQEEYNPFLKIVEKSGAIADHVSEVKELLTGNGYEILGEYQPASNSNLYVIAYTNDKLKSLVLNFQDRGMLASTLKIGFVVKEGKTTISMQNPIYMFYAYLREGLEQYETEMKQIDSQIKETMSGMGKLTGFGGELSKKKLGKYRYMFGMQNFHAAVELNEFNSFEDGVQMIRKNLVARKGNCVKVYELVNSDAKSAVFGVGLLDADEGENDFLTTIGEDHIAAMPYEIILQGKTATMLHGRYRFALYWPELTMGTFMKIMSTPGNVEDFLEDLTN